MAESKSLRKTVSDLDHRIVGKSRVTYSRQIVQERSTVWKKIRKFVKREAKGMLALTTDMLEDRKQKSFCSITAHFAGKDCKLRRIVPAIKFLSTGGHTSKNIADVVERKSSRLKETTT